MASGGLGRAPRGRRAHDVGACMPPHGGGDINFDAQARPCFRPTLLFLPSTSASPSPTSPTTPIAMLASALRRAATVVARPRPQRLHTLPRACSFATRSYPQPVLQIPRLRKAFHTTPAKSEQPPDRPPPPRPKRSLPSFRTVLKYSAYIAGSTVVGVFVLTGCIFLHDAFTYNEKVRRAFALRHALR